MKKLFCALLAGAMMTFGVTGVYAAGATVKINAVSYDKTTEKVSVTAVITDAAESQSITVMSTGIKGSSEFDLEEIVHIDQNDDVSIDSDGSFSLDFYLSDQAVKGTRYFVRIGGTDISEPAYAAFLFSDDGSDPEIIYGDVDNNGVADANDAVMMINYVLDPSSEGITDKGFENAQIRKNAIENNQFTAADASMILEKAKNSNFKFPVEE